MAEYTSSSEFEAEKRIQITNEVPPMDIYENLHGALRNPMWQWLCGFSRITYDCDATPKYVELEDGELSQVNTTYAKTVNGTVADEYGPKPTQVWDSEQGTYVTKEPTYHNMEIDGVIMPENDLYLHEIYRYMECLYPDHPDWLELLTHNEIIDAFQNAAAMVDYKPNDEFFRLAAESMTAGGDTEREAFKLELRNLTDNAYRRKLYGSYIGQREFVGDIGEIGSVFPMGTYLPIQPIDKENDNPEAKAKIIDTYDEHYKCNFRLIDWDGDSRKIAQLNTKTKEFTGYTIPGADYNIIEYDTNYTVLDTESEMVVPTIGLGERVENDSYISSDVLVVTAVSKNINFFETLYDGENVKTNISSEKLFYIETNKRSPILYSTVYKLANIIQTSGDGSLAEMIKDFGFSAAQIADFKNPANIKENAYDLFIHRMGELGNTIYDLPKHKVYNNPFVRDTMGLEPSEMIKLYPSNDNGSLFQYDAGSNLYRPVAEPPVNQDALSLVPGDIIIDNDIVSDKNHNGLLYEIMGANTGWIDITNEVDPDMSKYEFSSAGEFNFGDNDYVSENYYAIVVNTLPNKESKTHQVVLIGKLQIQWEPLAQYHRPAKCRLYISNIPDEKTEIMIDKIYPQYLGLKSTLSSLKIELEKTYIPEDYTFETYYAGWKAGTLPEEVQPKEHVTELLTQADEIIEAIAELKANKEYLYETVTATDVNGEEFEYERLLISSKSKVESYFNTSYNGEEINVGSVNYLFEKGVVDYFNIGNLSVYPLVNMLGSSGAFLADTDTDLLGTAPVYKTTDDDGYEVTYYIPVVREDVLTAKDSFGIHLSKMPHATTTADGTLINGSKENIFFLNDGKHYNNITVSLKGTSYIDIGVRADINDISTKNKLFFESEASKKMYDSLTVGDKVYGEGLPDNVYITHLENHTATLSHDVPHSGNYVLRFKVQMNIFPEDITDDLSFYKNQLDSAGTIEYADPKSHGLYDSPQWPYVARNVVIDGLLEATQWKPYKAYYDDHSFFDIVQYLYQGKQVYSNGAATKLLVPSTVKFDKNVWVEINANKLQHVPNRAGESETIMNVEWLDYITDNFPEIGKATENFNAGVNVTMQTDTSGYYTYIPEAKYTDDSLQIMFQTFDWTSQTIPAYVQIGSGGQAMRKYFKAVSDTVYPNVYGGAFYDKENLKINEEETLLELDGGKYQKRNVYSKGDVRGEEEDEELKSITEVDDMKFEVPLGEYNIIKNYMDNGGTANVAIDVSFYKQQFKNITKKLDNVIINNSEANSHESLTSFGDSPAKISEYYEDAAGTLIHYVDDESEPHLAAENDKVTFEYAGEWEPGQRFNETTQAWEIAYPEITDTLKGKYDSLAITYYSVFKGVSVTITNPRASGGFSTETTNFEDTSIIMLTKNGSNYEWKPFTFECGGVIAPRLYEEKIEGLMDSHYSTAWLTKSDFNVTTVTNDTAGQSFSSSPVINLTLISLWHALYLHGKTKTQFFPKEDFAYATFNNKVLVFCYIKGFWPSMDTILNDREYYALVPVDGQYRFARLKHNNFILSMGWTLPTASSTYEFKTFYGTNDKTIYKAIANKDMYDTLGEIENPNYHITMSDLDNFELVPESSTQLNDEAAVTKVKLPRKCINEGNFDIQFIVDPKFRSKGYLFDDYAARGTEANEITFNVSKAPIYYDDTLKCFYTNSDILSEDGTVVQEAQKIVLKFEEQRFFKNVKTLMGTYKTASSQASMSSTLNTSATVTSVMGCSFDISNIGSSDRILKVTEKTLRSIYAGYLESVQFANFTDHSGTIYGISEDDELFISANRDSESNFAALRNEWAADVQKYTPVTLNSANERISLLESSNYAWDIEPKEGEEAADDLGIEQPVLLDARVKVPYSGANMAEDPIDYEFKYFKNPLIFEAKIDLAQPNKILPDVGTGSTRFQEAMSKVAENDTIEAIYQLSGTEENTHSIKFEVTPPNSSFSINAHLPSCVTYDVSSQTIFLVSDDGTIYYGPLTNLSSTKVCKVKAVIPHFNLPTEQGNCSVASCEVVDNALRIEFILASEILADGTQYGSRSVIYKVDGPDWTNIAIDNALVGTPKTNELKELTTDGYIPVLDVDSTGGNAPYYTNQYHNGSELASIVEIKPENIFARDFRKVYKEEPEGQTINPNDLDSEAPSDYFTIDNTLCLEAAPTTRQVYAASDLHHVEIFAVDETIYVKSLSKTKTGALTSKTYWKKATLPIAADRTELLIKTMSETAAYEYVKELWEEHFSDDTRCQDFADGFAALNSDLAKEKTIDSGKTNKDYIANWVKTNIKNYPPLDYETFKTKLNGNFYENVLPIKQDGDKFLTVIQSYTNPTVQYKIPANHNTAGEVVHSIAYYDYLALYMQCVIMLPEYEYLGVSAIKEIKFNSDSVTFEMIDGTLSSIDYDKLNDVEDIEDGRNWSVVQEISRLSMLSESTERFIHSDIVVPGQSDPMSVVTSTTYALQRAYTTYSTMFDGGNIYRAGSVFSYNHIKELFDQYCTLPSWSALSTTEDPYLKSFLEYFQIYARESVESPVFMFKGDSCGFTAVPLTNLFANESIKDKSIRLSGLAEVDGKLVATVSYNDNGWKVYNKQVVWDPAENSAYDYENPYLATVTTVDFSDSVRKELTEGYITYWPKKLGVGIDCESKDKNTFSIDYTGQGQITIPEFPKNTAKNVGSDGFDILGNFCEAAASSSTNTQVRVLVCMKTVAAIDNPAQYLDTEKLEEYAPVAYKTFRVPTVIEVDSPSKADYMYSYREAMVNRPWKFGDGYPALDEDTEKQFYEYQNIIVDGNSVQVPVALVNESGKEISLCDSQGRALVDKVYNIITNNDFWDLYKKLSQGVSAPTAWKTAYKPVLNKLSEAKDNMSLYQSDTVFENIINATDIKMRAFDYNNHIVNNETAFPTSSNYPYIKWILQDGAKSAMADYLISTNPWVLTEENADPSLDTSWVRDTTADYWTDYRNLNYITSGNESLLEEAYISITGNTWTADFVGEAREVWIANQIRELTREVTTAEQRGNPYTSFEQLINFIERVEGQFGSYNNLYNTPFERFESRTLDGAEEGPKYIYDKRYGVFPLRNIRYIYGQVQVPYTSNVNTAVLRGVDFTLTGNNKDILTNDSVPAISGIYYNPKGYGGTRNNTSSIKAPWDLDPAAFDTTKLLKNDLGLYVKCVDKNGGEVKYVNAVSYTRSGEELKINKDWFTSNILTLNGDFETVGKRSQNFLKVEESKITQRHSQSFVYGSGHIAVLRFYKNNALNTDAQIYTIKENGRLTYASFYLDGNEAQNVSKFKLEKENDTLYLTYDGELVPLNTVTKVEIDFMIGTQHVSSTFYYGPQFTSFIPVEDLENDYSKDINGSYVIESTAVNNITLKAVTSIANDTFEIKGQNIISYNVETVDGESLVHIACSTMDPAYEITVGTQAIPYYSNCLYKDVEKVFSYSYPVNAANVISGIASLSAEPEMTTWYGKIVGDRVEKLTTVPAQTCIPLIGVFPITDVNQLVITPTNEEISITMPFSGIVKGLYGSSISYVPKYPSFYALTNDLGYTISTNSDNTVEWDGTDLTKVGTKGTANEFFDLSNPIANDFGWNDNNEHYLEFKILTVAEAPLTIDKMNDPSQFVEVSKDEIDLYTPNRVYFNPLGIPQPPVTIGSKIFNQENNYAFYNAEYTNKNGAKIYQCNEHGQYVGYRMNGEDVEQYVLGVDGNLSGAISYGLDLRFNPKKPIYDTCFDWFKNAFYIKGEEQNPFWQIFDIKSKFDKKSKKFVQLTTANNYTKATGKMKLTPIANDDLYMTLNPVASKKVMNGSVTTNLAADYVDLHNGTIDMLIAPPAEKYQTVEDFVKFGISYKNSFIGSPIWNVGGKANIDCYIKANYTVNTTKNYAFANETDSSIVQIKEMGIFDINHKLIAYAQFPAIEYRSETQHLSFTCFIRDGKNVAPES